MLCGIISLWIFISQDKYLSIKGLVKGADIEIDEIFL